jgi:uncharacterized membrane protein YcgQ (UPF0703/DUF1980 family)
MKITGYTILFFILSVILIYGFIQLELWMYETMYLTGKRKNDFIGINCFIFIILFLISLFSGLLDPIHKLLKKRIF